MILMAIAASGNDSVVAKRPDHRRPNPDL